MVLFVGRIQPIKGVDMLSADRAGAGAEARAARPGQPEHRRRRRRDDARQRDGAAQGIAAELGIEDLVLFLDPAIRTRWWTTTPRPGGRRAVVHESFGMVALEAMACGTPVIASDVGGLSLNIADGFNGYLVASGDVEELAYKITLLLTQDELRRQLGRQARVGRGVQLADHRCRDAGGI